MRLVFVNRFFHPDESATSQLLTDLCVHLAAAGHEVHVVASRQLHQDPKARLPVAQSHRGVRVHRVATTRFGRFNLAGRAIDYLTFYVAAGARLAAVARAGDIVIAETDPPLISVVAAWICRRKRARLVNWVQDLFPDIAMRLGVRGLAGPGGSVMTWLRNYSLRRAALNVALGELMASQLRRQAPLVRVEVLPNWADGRNVRPVDASENPLRRDWALADRFVVGYSGNMGRAHEFETILQACQRLRERRDIAFLFIGAGPQRALIEAEAANRDLTNIVFRPFQPREHLAMSLSAADVHLVTLQPALEGLIVPSKFYGIAAAGRATLFVGDPRGEIARILQSGGCGVSIETGDVGGLAAAIERMSADRAGTAAMGRRARVVFEGGFDAAQAFARWESLLAGLGAAPGQVTDVTTGVDSGIARER